MSSPVKKHLKEARLAIDEEFGVGYAIKNPNLVAQIATLSANGERPFTCPHPDFGRNDDGRLFCQVCGVLAPHTASYGPAVTGRL